MAVAQLILLAVFGTAVHGYSLPTLSEELTLDEYLGVMYTIGATHKYQTDLKLRCIWSNSKRLGDDDKQFKEITKMYSIYPGGVSVDKIEAVGEVVDSELRITIPTKTGNFTTVFTVTPYYNGEQYIMHDKDDQYNNILVSRTPNAPADVVEELEKIADNLGAQVSYFSHEDCTYA